MQGEQDFTPVQTIGDTLIAVRSTRPDEQQILVQATERGEALARLLAGKAVEQQDGFFVVPHDQAVDLCLQALADTFITIRWSHPTYTQLTLQMR